jgi:outer membrane lipoprotein-sorting protein
MGRAFNGSAGRLALPGSWPRCTRRSETGLPMSLTRHAAQWLLMLMLGLLAGCGPNARGESDSGAATAPVTLADVRQALARTETVFTHFTQERHLSLFNEPLRTEGWLCFVKPRQVRWEISQPYQSILVSDSSGVAQFERIDNRWKKLDLGMADAMQQVVAQIAAVMEGRYAAEDRNYSVTLTNRPSGPVVILVPRNERMRKVMRTIEVHLAPDLSATQGVVLREINGDFTEIHFQEQILGRVFPDRTFDRESPLELDVIREALGKKAP